jgi:hypothetical protein
MKALPPDDVPSVKVYLGLPLFGARALSDGAESLARRQAEDYASRIFEPVVVGAAKELPAVLKTLREKRCLGPNEEIGLFSATARRTLRLHSACRGNRLRRPAALVQSIPLKASPIVSGRIGTW